MVRWRNLVGWSKETGMNGVFERRQIFKPENHY